jgi:Cys-rich protein (TIGR01571 family)
VPRRALPRHALPRRRGQPLIAPSPPPPHPPPQVGIIGGAAALLRLCPELDVSRDVAGRDVDLGGPASGICRKVVLANYLIWLLAVPGYLLLVVWAARRRTAMRGAFGIPGSCGGDCCAWLCCGVCALAQETRTLMHNNCYAGQWLGPIDAATLRVQEADRFLPPAQQTAPTV